MLIFQDYQFEKYNTYDMIDFIKYNKKGSFRMKFYPDLDFDNKWIEEFERLKSKDKIELIKGCSAVINEDLTSFKFDW